MPWRKWAEKVLGTSDDPQATDEEGKKVAEHLRLLADGIEKSSATNVMVDWGSIERLASGILKVALDVQTRNITQKGDA